MAEYKECDTNSDWKSSRNNSRNGQVSSRDSKSVQRLKEQNNEQYLVKERERRRRTYVTNAHLSKKERDERNRKNRDYLRLYRYKKKERMQNVLQNENEATAIESSGYERASVGSPNRLQVRMNFVANRRNDPIMRVSKELQKTKKEMKKLKDDYEKLRRKHNSSMRNIQRKRKTEEHADTPRSKAAKLIEKLKLKPKQRLSVQKELIFTNAVCGEIRTAAHKAPLKSKKILQNLVAGNLLRKYKLIKKFGKKTGMCRNKLSKVQTKNVDIQKIRRRREAAKTQKKVIQFLEKDKNSRNH